MLGIDDVGKKREKSGVKNDAKYPSYLLLPIVPGKGGR
jgi:hypothetical protein